MPSKAAVRWAKVRITILGEWVGARQWIAGPWTRNDGDRERLGAYRTEDGNENTELEQILSAIAEEVNRHCATVCDGINADFAARAAHAQRFLPRSQVAAALAAIQQARKVALAAAQSEARARLKARQREATILYYRRSPRVPSARRRGLDGEPTQ